MSFIIRNVEHQDRPTVEVTLFRQMVMWKTLKAIWNMEEAGAQASNIQTKWSNLMSVWGFWAWIRLRCLLYSDKWWQVHKKLLWAEELLELAEVLAPDAEIVSSKDHLLHLSTRMRILQIVSKIRQTKPIMQLSRVEWEDFSVGFEQSLQLHSDGVVIEKRMKSIILNVLVLEFSNASIMLFKRNIQIWLMVTSLI